MTTMKKTTFRNEKGFALLAAIIASMILIAVAMLVINMSVGDALTSTLTMGNKKAMLAAESGIDQVIQNFNPNSTLDQLALNGKYTTTCLTNPNPSTYNFQSIPNATDHTTKVAICSPVQTGTPVIIPGNSTCWANVRYQVSVVGENTSYNSQAQIDVGIGFGPVWICP